MIYQQRNTDRSDVRDPYAGIAYDRRSVTGHAVLSTGFRNDRQAAAALLAELRAVKIFCSARLTLYHRDNEPKVKSILPAPKLFVNRKSSGLKGQTPLAGTV